MARKTSDMAMLLGRSGKSRSHKGGLSKKLVGFIDTMLGRAGKRGIRQERRQQSVPLLIVGIVVLLSFGSGYAIGSGASDTVDGIDSLRAPAGREPTFVDEIKTKPLAGTAFIVSGYPGVPSAEGRSLANDLAKYLDGNGLHQKVRPYPWPRGSGTCWVVAVYFDGESDKEKVATLLRSLPLDVPDEAFCKWRENGEDGSWPSWRAIPTED